MGDENPIRTLGHYFKPSHKGYRNTIEFPVGNNVVPLRSDTIWLVQNRCSFHGLRSEDPNQHLKDFLKLMESLDLDGWNDAFIPYEVSLNYENPDIKQLLGIMERKFDTLMKDAISLIGKSDSVLWLITNEMYRPPSEPSHQEEFEYIVMNFIFDQEERIRQLESYMQVITDEFMEFSSEVTRRLKERIKENDNKPRKIEKITKYPDTKVLENSDKHNVLENLKKKTFPTPANLLYVRYFRLIPSNPSRPRKNTFGFKPGKRANQSYHNQINFLTVQPPTQSDPTFVDNDPNKHDPSPHCLFTYVECNRGFDLGGKTYDLSLKGSQEL
ncbi:hypothetical protein Tco_0619535 [Tanacetum coccineum]